MKNKADIITLFEIETKRSHNLTAPIDYIIVLIRTKYEMLQIFFQRSAYQ